MYFILFFQFPDVGLKTHEKKKNCQKLLCDTEIPYRSITNPTELYHGSVRGQQLMGSCIDALS